jgi:hypothetical protein
MMGRSQLYAIVTARLPVYAPDAVVLVTGNDPPTVKAPVPAAPKAPDNKPVAALKMGVTARVLAPDAMLKPGALMLNVWPPSPVAVYAAAETVPAPRAAPAAPDSDRTPAALTVTILMTAVVGLTTWPNDRSALLAIEIG